MSWIFAIGKNKSFFYGDSMYCTLFFYIVCEYYSCVVLYDFWEIITKPFSLWKFYVVDYKVG